MPTRSRICPSCGVDKIKEMGWEKQDEHVCGVRRGATPAHSELSAERKVEATYTIENAAEKFPHLWQDTKMKGKTTNE